VSDDCLYIWMRRREGSDGPWMVPKSTTVVTRERLEDLQYAMHVSAQDTPGWEHAIFRVELTMLWQARAPSPERRTA